MQRISLFDKTVYSHGYIDEYGDFVDDVDYITTDFTVCYPEVDIYYENVPTNSYVSFYNKLSKFILRENITNSSKITPPKDVSFVRITVPKDNPLSILEGYNFWLDPYANDAHKCTFGTGTYFDVERRGHNLVVKNLQSNEESDYPLTLDLFDYKYYETQSQNEDTETYYLDVAQQYKRLKNLTSEFKVLVSFSLTSIREISLELGIKDNSGLITHEKVRLQGTQTFTYEYTCDGNPDDWNFTPFIIFPKYIKDGFTVFIRDISVSLNQISTRRLSYFKPEEKVRFTIQNGEQIQSGALYRCSYILSVIPTYNMYMFNYPLDFNTEVAFTKEYPAPGVTVSDYLELEQNDNPSIIRVPTNANYALVRPAGDNNSSQYHNKITESCVLSGTHPLSMLDNVSIYQDVESFATFREDIYTWVKETLSPNLTKGDLDIIIRLMCYIFGDLTGITESLKDQIDVDRSEEYYLRHLCTVIGYEWNEALTADQQRESIKLYVELRRRRGTKWSIENLIKVFGQDAKSYYSTTDLRGVRAIEYQPNDPETFEKDHLYSPDENGLYPGDILLEVPQFSSILRFAIDNIRLIGTRIIFCYMIYCGIFKMQCTVDCGREVHQFFDPADWGYDPVIKTWGPQELDTPIETIKDWFITHRVRSAVSHISASIYVYYKEPYERGFIWNESHKEDYKGFLIDDETIKDDHDMYS